MRDGQRIIAALYNDRELLPDNEPPAALESLHRDRVRTVYSLFGPLELRRNYLHHAKSGSGRFPLDETLGMEAGCTPSVAKLICRAASRAGSYQEASHDLLAYAGLNFDARDLGRMVATLAPKLRVALKSLPQPTPRPASIDVLYVSCDGTGTPMRREELQGRKGRQDDGSARTREAKLGCVFTQTDFDSDGRPLRDEEGNPLRDPDSTSYVGTYQGCRQIAVLLHQEARRRGLDLAKRVVFIGDGAAWVWENARLTFPGAIEILDFYHACGMGLVAETSRDLTVRRVSALLRKGSGRMVSLNADALHFVGCSGRILVEDCASECQLDDALNIHGQYAFVAECAAADTLELALKHHEQAGFDFCLAGDVLEFHHRDTLRVLGQAVVRSVEEINARYRIATLEKPVKSLLASVPAVAENISQVADLTVRGCRSIGNRGRGFLLKARGRTVICGNTFSTGGAGIVIEGKTSGFCETGPVRDVLIEDNDFVDCKRGPWGRALIDIRPMPQQLDPLDPWYHHNIRIVGNRFRTFDPGIIAACCARDLLI